jgi:hypothetical protein
MIDFLRNTMSFASGTEGPIVVNMKGVVVDGNHRHATAEKNGNTTIPAYVPVGWQG